ncbi:hypothetical protein BTURTLESOX_223 [bacterium endosymbiont of Bathymodiolus sp. 5 South]|nr:hypothetical protein BTURTLESOX_223 [bacterium endosymbiont of Bathymodiolus sp. 5 South]
MILRQTTLGKIIWQAEKKLERRFRVLKTLRKLPRLWKW